MAKLSIGDKARRTLDFLLGVRNPRIASALEAYGFTDADLQEGWARLQSLTSNRLDKQASVVDPRLINELDAWENRWFPICEVVLRTNYPEVHEAVFLNLAQTHGAEVVLSVSTLLDRIEEIGKPVDEGGFGEVGGEARALLERRGLAASVVVEARELLDEIARVQEPAPEIDVETAREEAEEAEQSLWNWYLEWSGIARVAISDRRLLRSLGFLRSSRKSSSNDGSGDNGSDEEDGDSDEDDDSDEELLTDSRETDSPVTDSPVTDSPVTDSPVTG